MDDELDDEEEDVELDFYETPLDGEDIDEYGQFKTTLLGTVKIVLRCSSFLSPWFANTRYFTWLMSEYLAGYWNSWYCMWL